MSQTPGEAPKSVTNMASAGWGGCQQTHCFGRIYAVGNRTTPHRLNSRSPDGRWRHMPVGADTTVFYSHGKREVSDELLHLSCFRGA